MINIEKILKEAIARNASDIHLVSGKKPILRVARTLEEMESETVLTDDDMYEMYDYFVRGNIDKDQEYTQTKKLDFSYEFGGVRFRGNISSSEEVPVATLRLIRNELPSFAELGIPDVVRRMMYQPQGLILVTGKTNSGKTTTLNSLIDYINENQNKKILTLENPVEYKHHSKMSLIVQKEVGKGRDSLTFSDGVKNALREDCDILVIGGGIAGLSTVYNLKDHGKRIILIDKNKCGMGATSCNTGKLTFMQDLIYHDIESNYNEKVARLYLNSQKEAINIITSIIKKEKIDCDLTKTNAYVFSNDEDKYKNFDKEIEFYKKNNISGNFRRCRRAAIPKRVC